MYSYNLGMSLFLRHPIAKKNINCLLQLLFNHLKPVHQCDHTLVHSKQSPDAYHNMRLCCHPWKMPSTARRFLKISFKTKLCSIILILPKLLSEILKHWLLLEILISAVNAAPMNKGLGATFFVYFSGKHHMAQFFSLKLVPIWTGDTCYS